MKKIALTIAALTILTSTNAQARGSYRWAEQQTEKRAVEYMAQNRALRARMRGIVINLHGARVQDGSRFSRGETSFRGKSTRITTAKKKRANK